MTDPAHFTHSLRDITPHQICVLGFQNWTCMKEFSRPSMRVEARAIPEIMRWYGALHCGDDYEVTINGCLIQMDNLGCVPRRSELLRCLVGSK